MQYWSDCTNLGADSAKVVMKFSGCFTTPVAERLEMEESSSKRQEFACVVANGKNVVQR